MTSCVWWCHRILNQGLNSGGSSCFYFVFYLQAEVNVGFLFPVPQTGCWTLSASSPSLRAPRLHGNQTAPPLLSAASAPTLRCLTRGTSTWTCTAAPVSWSRVLHRPRRQGPAGLTGFCWVLLGSAGLWQFGRFCWVLDVQVPPLRSSAVLGEGDRPHQVLPAAPETHRPPTHSDLILVLNPQIDPLQAPQRAAGRIKSCVPLRIPITGGPQRVLRLSPPAGSRTSLQRPAGPDSFRASGSAGSQAQEDWIRPPRTTTRSPAGRPQRNQRLPGDWVCTRLSEGPQSPSGLIRVRYWTGSAW